MINAKSYGVKLTISMYSYNALEAQPPQDFYGTLPSRREEVSGPVLTSTLGKWYGTGDFYTDANAIQYFKNRIAHIMNHVNSHTGKKWADSSEYIFSFEAQNEAMHDNVRPCSFPLSFTPL